MMAAPQWDVALATSSVLSASVYPPFWTSVANRMMRQTSTSTGMQYELGSAQTGEMHPTMDNRDGAFSPVNTSSPYSPQVTAFKPFRIRAQYPSTVQLLTADQATSGEGTPQPAGTLGTAFGCTSDYDLALQVVASGSAWQGSQVLTATVPNAAVAGGMVAYCSQWTIYTGRQHSYQVHVRIPTGTVNPTVAATLRWIGLSNNILSDSIGTPTVIAGGSAGWITLTVTGTPPAGAAGAACGVQLTSGASGAFTMQVDGQQCELAGAPSTWVTPGTWFPVFFGGVERWPQVYSMGGTFGQTQPVIVDPFALLAGTYPLPAFYSDVLALSPSFFFPLDDPAASTVFRELTGTYNPAPLVNSQQGAGSLQAGSGVQSTTPGAAFLGGPGPVVAFNNVDNVSNAAYSPGTFIELDKVGVTGPPTTGNWTRMAAFRCTAVPSNTSTIWSANQPGWQVASGILPATVTIAVSGVALNPGQLAIEVGTGTSGSLTLWYSGSSLCDGNWHLIVLVSSSNGNLVTAYIDGVPHTVYSAGTSGVPAFPCAADTVGEATFPGSNQTFQGMQGSVAHIGQFPVALNSTQVSNLYVSWRSAWSGDTSGTRYGRILNYAGYPGVTQLATGATTDMGPATDIDGKTDALTLLQNVVTTENGVHYAGHGGSVVFEARTARYNKLTPTYTFGEQAANGEWPYEDVAFDFDTTHVIGQVQITQNFTGQIFIANSPTTLAPNYRPTYQRTINVVNPQECVDAANYLANRYATPQLRIQKLRLHPAALANFWPVALSLSISMRVRVMRRPPAYTSGTPIQFDGFVENIRWSFDWDSGDAYVDLEISPANLQLYWVNAALHTTLHAQANSGGNTAVLNPLPDSATNSFSQSVCNSLQLTFEPGTANTETLTVQSVSATAPGYTSVTVTFTTNLANTHAINTTVCEALPAGITDPTTWDTAAVCGVTTTPSY